jgi:L-amino acid N-acyltransferase YncA
MLNSAYPKEVTLKDGQKVILRPLARGDFQRLSDFFHSLDDEDRLYLADNVLDPDLIRGWVENIDFERVIPIIALNQQDHVVADGTLHINTSGWARHVGHVRLVVGPKHRHAGLGTVIARELVALAEERGLEKLQAHVIEDAAGPIRMFEQLGFQKAAVIPGLVKDVEGNRRNLLFMINEVSSLGRIMEDWIVDSMIPAYRIPGGGEG